MKTLVAYYSRTGNNRQVAEYIAETLQDPLMRLWIRRNGLDALGI